MIAKLIESSFNFSQLDPLQSYSIRLNCLPNNDHVIHSVFLNDAEYTMEIKNTFFIDEKTILINGFLANKDELGLVTFELKLSNN